MTELIAGMIFASLGICAFVFTEVILGRALIQSQRREELWAQKVMSRTYLDYALHAPQASAIIERAPEIPSDEPNIPYPRRPEPELTEEEQVRM